MSDLIVVPNVVDKFNNRWAYTSKAIDANNTTASITLWTITGSIMVSALYGIVETTLGSNHTAAHFRLNDGTVTPAITLASGTTLSSFTDQSTLIANASGNSIFADNAATNPPNRNIGTLRHVTLSAYGLGAKNGGTTTIEYRYTTTNTPTSGQIGFYVHWRPLSNGATLV